MKWGLLHVLNAVAGTVPTVRLRDAWHNTVHGDQAPLGRPGLQDAERGSPFTDDLSRFVDGVMDEWKVPGMSIAVVDGHRVFTRGFGHAALPDTPATPDTLYYVGSTTKAQLAAALSQLIDSGAYASLSARGWKTAISSVIRDDFVLRDEWATAHLTLDDAVSHRTGLTRHDGSWHREGVNGSRVSVRDVVRNLRNLPPPSVEPRTEWHYCNLMFVTLSHVVETVTGRGLADVLRELIWAPLGMDTTYLDLDDAKRAPVDLARSYMWKGPALGYQEMPLFPSAEASGAGGVISNVVDYAKWIHCLIHETEPLTDAVHRDIRTARSIQSPLPGLLSGASLYSLGWMRTTIHGVVVYQHGGSTMTYGADVYWFPDLKYGVVALANSDGTSNEAEAIVLRRIIEDRLRIPPSERVDINKILNEQRAKAVHQLKHAQDIVFPDTPQPKLPSSVPTSRLAGLYQNQGYGSIRLAEEEAPHGAQHQRQHHGANETLLVANRTELMFQHQVRLRHVSGDYWLAYFVFAGELDTQTQFHAARFLFGVDGSPHALAIDYFDQAAGVSEGTVVYSKTA